MIIRILTVVALLFLLARMLLVRSTSPIGVPGRVTIEMSVWGMPFENDLYTKVYIPEFERQNPGIKVAFHHFEDYPNRILLSHAGAIAPDVIREFAETSAAWTKRGLNLPLDRFIDGPDGIDRSDFVPLLWDEVRSGGETYGVPQDINLLGLFYNKDLFDKAGLAYPDANWTWADLKRAVDRLTIDADGDGNPEQKGLDMAWGGGMFRPFLYQNGGRFWDGEKPAFATPETAEALKFYRSLMKTYSLTRSNQGRGGLGPDKFFAQGRVGMFIDGSWIVPSVRTSLEQAGSKMRFGVAPLPRGKFASSVSGSCSWAIDKDTKHPEEAWKLVKFLSGEWALKKYWQALYVAPPARWSALRSPEFRDVTGSKGGAPALDTPEKFTESAAWITQVLENGWTTMEYVTPYTDRMMVEFNEAIDKVLIENADPEKVLREAQRKATKAIADAKASERTP